MSIPCNWGLTAHFNEKDYETFVIRLPVNILRLLTYFRKVITLPQRCWQFASLKNNNTGAATSGLLQTKPQDISFPTQKSCCIFRSMLLSSSFWSFCFLLEWCVHEILHCQYTGVCGCLSEWMRLPVSPGWILRCFSICRLIVPQMTSTVSY